MKAISVNIYRNSYRCEINQFNEVETVLIPCEEGYIDIKGNEPNILRIVKRNLFGGDYIHVEPANPHKEGESFAFGGSFIYSSDSRFSAISKYPIPLHDRMMSKE